MVTEVDNNYYLRSLSNDHGDKTKGKDNNRRTDRRWDGVDPEMTGDACI